MVRAESPTFKGSHALAGQGGNDLHFGGCVRPAVAQLLHEVKTGHELGLSTIGDGLDPANVRCAAPRAGSPLIGQKTRDVR